MIAALAEEQRIYNEESEVIDMHIACGYAVYDPQTDKNMEDIRIRADERMYEHKRQLKNVSVSREKLA
jgi:GGDEF domain-containing protein